MDTDDDLPIDPATRIILESLETSRHHLPLDEWADLLQEAARSIYVDPPPPPTPCFAEPGTEAKIQELEARIASGWSLYHPADLSRDPFAHGARRVVRGNNGSVTPLDLIDTDAGIPSHGRGCALCGGTDDLERVHERRRDTFAKKWQRWCEHCRRKRPGQWKKADIGNGTHSKERGAA